MRIVKEARSSVSRNSSSPIPGRLVVKSKYQTPVSAPHKRTHPWDSRTRLCDKLRKIRDRTYTKNRLSGLNLDLIQGRVFPTENKLKILEKAVQDMEIASQTTPRLLISLIGVLASLEKPIPMGRLRMHPFQWYLKTNWQYPQSLVLKIPVSNFLKSHLQWWKDPKNLKNGLSVSSTGTQYPYFHKCIKSRLGSSFRKHDSQWQLDRSRKLLHINVLELKAVFLALKELSKQILDKRVLIATHNATVVSYLSKQEGTHSWDRCLLVWRILAYCNPRNILIRARHIQGCLNVIVDSLSRKDQIIQTEGSLHS